MIRLLPLLVILTLPVLVSAAMAGTDDATYPNLTPQEAVDMWHDITDTSAIWTDPLPDSTIIALRLALKHLRGGPVYTPGFIQESDVLRWRADQLDKKTGDTALIKRVLKAWEARP